MVISDLIRSTLQLRRTLASKKPKNVTLGCTLKEMGVGEEEEAAEEGTNRRRSGTNIEHTVSSIYLSIFVSLSEVRASTCCRS